MLEILREVERDLPDMLLDESSWRSLDVNYDQPRVERLYRQHGENRIYLHRIHPCSTGQPLMHPHPWPSVVRVLSGLYEMGMGVNSDNTTPSVVVTLYFYGAGLYEMTDPAAWHYVRPLGGPSFSLMVAGPKWDRWAPSSSVPLQPLQADEIREIFEFFRSRYPK